LRLLLRASSKDLRTAWHNVQCQTNAPLIRAPFDPEHDDDDCALVDSLVSDGQRVPILLVEVPNSVPLEYTVTFATTLRRRGALFPGLPC
jgi:hypothetical protein